ncbi:adenylyl-sulfate kinase [Kribbella voronezhensis]|uniref:adenylyl-sulfate kinase n=1 Tax=Kribbella voronezhensis TaxID=2512212 RepID=UPI001EDDBB9C|nr:adenylyl-sulfate kinase [Kribbella voronezhensis]
MGEPPADGRVRIPAGEDDIARALVAGEVVVGDCESTPVAVLSDLSSSPDAGWIEGRLAGVGEGAELPAASGRTRVVVTSARPLTEADVESVRRLGADEVVLVVPESGASPDGVPAGVLRQCLELVAPEDFTLVPMPVSWRGSEADEALTAATAARLEGTHLWRLRPATETGADKKQRAGDELWAEGLERLREATSEPASSADVLLDKAMPVLGRWRPPRRQRGVVVFFTGFSGSGKSTLAKGLADYLTGQVDRAVTLLDGDVVRRLLSSGLGFDRAGRDLNVRRIGFVAAEVARHGGIAVCAPIAPYAESRAAVREMVEAVGDLVLVHVATPLAECERRDVKGLYKKARAGVVTQFTGISDPYDEPLDAELRVDTTGASFEESLAVITDFLAAGGWLPTQTTQAAQATKVAHVSPSDPQPEG